MTDLRTGIIAQRPDSMVKVERSLTVERLRGRAWWVFPALFCLLLYWPAARAWFLQDDFAWLKLRLGVDSWGELLAALFAPKAQGTIRPLSERAFFLIFSTLFGLNPLPFRVWVFLTQFANLALLSSIARRLTGSRAAGLLAALLWTANIGTAYPLTWLSAYNQILCAFFFLAAFRLLLAYLETGRTRWWAGQWIAFLLGFGALEIMVVYPALAAAYTLSAARRHFRKTLPMFAPSLAFVWLHNHLAPKAAAGAYGMYFDAGIFATLKTYWAWVLGPAQLEYVVGLPVWAAPAATGLLTAALLGFAGWKAWQRQWLGVFLLVWFLFVLAPVLPLRNHVSEYYLTVPALGLAVLGAWAVRSAWRGGWAWKLAAVALAGIYLASSLPSARVSTAYHSRRSLRVRGLIEGVARARYLHPHKGIVLEGVDTELFWAALADDPFRLLGIRDVYLAPGSEAHIEAYPELGDVASWVLAGQVGRWGLARDLIVVYDAGGPRLKAVTSRYWDLAWRQWKPEEPWRVEVGNPLYAGQLGSGWHRIEDGYRWMGERATVRLKGPQQAGQRLCLSGFRPSERHEPGTVTVTVAAGGQRLARISLPEKEIQFSRDVPLPPELTGQPALEVSLEVDRTVSPGPERRRLGLVFGSFEIR